MQEAAVAAFTAGMHWTALVMTAVVVLAAFTVARMLRPAVR